MSRVPPHTPESPCVNICVIHPEAEVCVGCLRRREEIAAWGRMSPGDRRAVMAVLPEREGLLSTRRGGRAGRLARREKGGADK